MTGSHGALPTLTLTVHATALTLLRSLRVTLTVHATALTLLRSLRPLPEAVWARVLGRPTHRDITAAALFLLLLPHYTIR